MASLLGGFQTKHSEEEDLLWRTTPKIDQFWRLFRSGGVFFLQVLDLETTQRRNHPEEVGFLRSNVLIYTARDTKNRAKMANWFRV